MQVVPSDVRDWVKIKYQATGPTTHGRAAGWWLWHRLSYLQDTCQHILVGRMAGAMYTREVRRIIQSLLCIVFVQVSGLCMQRLYSMHSSAQTPPRQSTSAG